MQSDTKPAARFQQIERVLFSEAKPGEHGVVLWRDFTYFHAYDHGFKGPPRTWSEWTYSLYLPDRDDCRSFRESQLQPTGEFDVEADHLGKRFEFSFDTVLEEDAEIVEGCYRIPGRFWEVFVFIKEDVGELRHELINWPSGIAGVQFEVPESARLDCDFVIRSLSDAFKSDRWALAYGPDSLLLK